MHEECTEDMVGRHEEKLYNLEKGQEDLRNDIKELKVEMKDDIKELVYTIKEIFTEKNKILEKRIDRIESVILWVCGGIVATVAAFVWTKVTGG